MALARGVATWIAGYVVVVTLALAVGRLGPWTALDVLFVLGALLVLLSIGWMRSGTDTPLKWSYEGGIPRWLPAPAARLPPGEARGSGFLFGVGLLVLGFAAWGTIAFVRVLG